MLNSAKLNYFQCGSETLADTINIFYEACLYFFSLLQQYIKESRIDTTRIQKGRDPLCFRLQDREFKTGNVFIKTHEMDCIKWTKWAVSNGLKTCDLQIPPKKITFQK